MPLNDRPINPSTGVLAGAIAPIRTPEFRGKEGAATEGVSEFDLRSPKKRTLSIDGNSTEKKILAHALGDAIRMPRNINNYVAVVSSIFVILTLAAIWKAFVDCEGGLIEKLSCALPPLETRDLMRP